MPPLVVPHEATQEVRERCLCLHVQRAARALARRFDAALRPFGLTSGQFSILMSLNRTDPLRVGDLAPFLAMDRTTLTAALKPLERRGLVGIARDPEDGRNRRLTLTPAGHAALLAALPAWRRTQDGVEAGLGGLAPDRFRGAMNALSALGAGGGVD